MTVSRRGFLAASALAGLTACHSSTAAPPSPSPTTTAPAPTGTPGTTTVSSTPRTTAGTPTPSAPTLAQLRARFGTRLLLPADPGYGSARLSYNPVVDGHRPALIARCRNPADVQAVLAYAVGSHLPVAARSGGHSYPGYSTPDRGVVIDLGLMNQVSVQPTGQVVIGPGARLGDVYAACAQAGRMIPGGSCPTVGIAGLALGGGLGFLGRSLGLTCDRVTSMTVVTADGQLRTATGSTEPDLLWALRGGGGGNFGIVTSFTLSSVPAVPLTVFSLGFPAGSVPAVFGAWQQFAPNAPNGLVVNCNIDAGSSPSCTSAGCFVGSPAQLNPLLDDYVRRAGVTPTRRRVSATDYRNAMEFFAGCGSLGTASCTPSWTGAGSYPREAFAASSRLVTRPVDPQAFVNAVAGSRIAVICDPFGGVIGNEPTGGSAVPFRSALASVQLYRSLAGFSLADASARVRGVRDRLTPLLGAHGYINYLDPSMPSWASTYYGASLPRLQQIAKKYDPERVLAFAQGLS